MTGPAQQEKGGASPHIVQRRLVDDRVGMPDTQQIEEVQPALARPRGEPGKVVVADLRAEAVLAGVTRTGVVHRDPRRRLQAGAQHKLLHNIVIVALEARTRRHRRRDDPVLDTDPRHPFAAPAPLPAPA